MKKSSFRHQNEKMRNKTTHLHIFVTRELIDGVGTFTKPDLYKHYPQGDKQTFSYPAAYYKHTVNATWSSINLRFIFPITAAYFTSVGRTWAHISVPRGLEDFLRGP